MCFNSSVTILFYALFPGQKLFLSLYNPSDSINVQKISGAAFFKTKIETKVTENLEELHKCTSVERNIFSVRSAHNKYEQWWVKGCVTCNIKFIYNIYFACKVWLANYWIRQLHSILPIIHYWKIILNFTILQSSHLTKI